MSMDDMFSPEGTPIKSRLAMTPEEYRAAGATFLDQVQLDNPGKTLAQTMDDAAIRAFILKEIEQVVEVHAEALKGDERMIGALRVVLRNNLVPDIVYLRQIGRLPEELKDFDPRTRFAL